MSESPSPGALLCHVCALGVRREYSRRACAPVATDRLTHQTVETVVGTGKDDAYCKAIL